MHMSRLASIQPLTDELVKLLVALNLHAAEITWAAGRNRRPSVHI